MREWIQKHQDAYCWCLIVLIIAMLAFMLGSCQGTRTSAALAELQQMQTVAMADGVVTPDEQAAIGAKQAEAMHVAEEETNELPGNIVTGLLTLLAGFAGVRVWRGPSTKNEQ